MTEQVIITKRGVYGRLQIVLPVSVKTSVLEQAKQAGMSKAIFLQKALVLGAEQLANSSIGVIAQQPARPWGSRTACAIAEQKELKTDKQNQFDTASFHGEWADFVAGLAKWPSFWTLTFDEADRTHAVSKDECKFLWRRLVQSLNHDLLGNHYTRIVGHSYFSYALAYEYQSRGAIHMHALVDGITNWEYANRLWRRMAGIIKIEPVDDGLKAAKYLCKYVTKGGDIDLYVAKEFKPPSFKPLWFLEVSEKLEAHSTE
jgi:hypothetical protein